MGRGQISTPRGLWKKQIPTVMDDSESFKISEKEMTTDVVNSQKTRLGMEPELRFAQPAGSCSHYTADALSLVISLT